MQLEGVYTALITPFQGDQLDKEGLVANIRFQIDSGIQGLVPLGTTGEGPTLSQEEREQVIRLTLETAQKRVPVFVGCGDHNTARTIEKCQHAQELGADGAMLVIPYYNKPTQEGLFRHFKAVAEAVNLPLMLYNIPGRTGVNMEPDTLRRIIELPTIIGVKESSGNIEQMSDMVQAIRGRPDFQIVSGCDSMTLPMMALGGRGIVSVVSNLIPREMVSLVGAALRGDWAEAQRLHYHWLPLFRASLAETNPVPIKEAMELCGLAAGGVRLPLYELRPETRARLSQLLIQLSLRRSL